MSTMTVIDFLWSVSSTLMDTRPQFMRWSEYDLITYVNDGQRALAKYLPRVSQRLIAIKLKPGTRQSIKMISSGDTAPWDGSTPKNIEGKLLLDVIRNMGANGSTPGATISPVERATLDGTDRMWHQSSGSSVENFVHDPRTQTEFYVYPGVPAAPAAVWVEVLMAVNPDEIPSPVSHPGVYSLLSGTSEIVLSVGDEYVDELRAYVLARSYAKDAENPTSAGLAQAYSTTFLNSLNVAVQAATGNNPNLTILPFAPDFPVTAQ